MNDKTAKALASLESDSAQGLQTITPAIYSWAFGRAATSAAFRMAKARGLIEVAYVSAAGTPVYRSTRKTN